MSDRRWWALSALVLAACDSASPSGPSGLVSGKERMLIVNGKLSDPGANYALNEKGGDGRWVGQQILVYDPSVRGQVRVLGRFDFGPDDPQHDFEQMQVRDLAYDPALGLWAIFIDTGFQDEWYLGEITVPSWDGTEQALTVRLYALAADDAMFLADEVRGLGACGGALLAGTPAVGAFPGSLYELAGPWPPANLAADAYYLAEARGALRLDFPENQGVAGDVWCAQGRAFALTTSGQDPSQVRLADLGAAAAGPPTWVGSPAAVDPVDPLESVAVVAGATLAVSLEGLVYRVDTATGALSAYDDLRPALPPDADGQSTRRLRGGATVELP